MRPLWTLTAVTPKTDQRPSPVAPGSRCKLAGAVPGSMLMLGDGCDSLGLTIGLGCVGLRRELAGPVEQRAAQVLQRPARQC